jgi:hypothetical protein
MLAAANRMLTSDSIITHHHPAAIVGGCFDQANGPGNAASGKPKRSRAAWSK